MLAAANGGDGGYAELDAMVDSILQRGGGPQGSSAAAPHQPPPPSPHKQQQLQQPASSSSLSSTPARQKSALLDLRRGWPASPPPSPQDAQHSRVAGAPAHQRSGYDDAEAREGEGRGGGDDDDSNFLDNDDMAIDAIVEEILSGKKPAAAHQPQSGHHRPSRDSGGIGGPTQRDAPHRQQPSYRPAAPFGQSPLMVPPELHGARARAVDDSNAGFDDYNHHSSNYYSNNDDNGSFGERGQRYPRQGGGGGSSSSPRNNGKARGASSSGAAAGLATTVPDDDALLRRFAMWEERKNAKKLKAVYEALVEEAAECTFHPSRSPDSLLGSKVMRGLHNNHNNNSSYYYDDYDNNSNNNNDTDMAYADHHHSQHHHHYGGGGHRSGAAPARSRSSSLEHASSSGRRRSCASWQSLLAPSTLYADNKAWGFDEYVARLARVRLAQEERRAEEEEQRRRLVDPAFFSRAPTRQEPFSLSCYNNNKKNSGKGTGGGAAGAASAAGGGETPSARRRREDADTFNSIGPVIRERLLFAEATTEQLQKATGAAKNCF